MAILLACEEGRLHGIAPLFLAVRALPFVRGDVGFLGATDICSEYLGLIIRRGYEERIVPAFMQFLFDHWGDSWDVLRWTDIPANSPQITLIDEFIAARGAGSDGCGGVRPNGSVSCEETAADGPPGLRMTAAWKSPSRAAQ